MKTLITLIFVCSYVFGIAQENTNIIVRAKAKDAKFIGSSMGGARVNIHNTETGELLATGIISGTTGNTDLIMRTPHERGGQLSDHETAKFETSLMLEMPILSTITVTAPLGQRQSAISSSTQVWLIPGKHITGDGIVLEFPGFVVDIQEPGAQSFIKSGTKGSTEIKLSAHVVMMCGCTITDGGLWDANNYEVKAIVMYKGKSHTSLALKLIADNQFEGILSMQEKGIYEIMVYAYDPITGNTGLDRTSLIIN
jgi:hypothetical protein